jgi:lipopolysaccharide export LptBFGC system permease protein LptF
MRSAAPWIAVYRRLLALLPAALRGKHGEAMVALYARDLERAQARGAWQVATTGLAGLYDLLLRSAVEPLRSRPDAPSLTTTSLRTLGAAFSTSAVALTLALLALTGRRMVPRLAERGESITTIVEALLLAVPFTAALTLPMAVLVAVLVVGAERPSSHRPRGIASVLSAAAVIAALALVVNTQVVPRTNERLSAVLTGGAVAASDRSMTVTELRAAARAERSTGAPDALTRIAAYEVEIHKKFALAAACLVLAVVGVALAQRAPSGHVAFVVAASVTVFVVYYLLLVTGETLADQRIVSPAVGMWSANALMLSLALLAVWRRGSRNTSVVV